MRNSRVYPDQAKVTKRLIAPGPIGAKAKAKAKEGRIVWMPISQPTPSNSESESDIFFAFTFARSGYTLNVQNPVSYHKHKNYVVAMKSVLMRMIVMKIQYFHRHTGSGQNQ